jgi:Domain of unknown function (DUF4440)
VKHSLTICIAVLLLIGGAPRAAAASDDPIVDQVSRANDIVQLATLKHDRKTMDSMLAKDFVLVLTHGDVLNRAEWLDGIADTSDHMELNQTSNLSIHHYNGDSAIVVGVLHIRDRTNNKVTDVRMRFIDVWVKQDGKWKWASSQVAHFPDRS